MYDPDYNDIYIYIYTHLNIYGSGIIDIWPAAANNSCCVCQQCLSTREKTFLVLEIQNILSAQTLQHFLPLNRQHLAKHGHALGSTGAANASICDCPNVCLYTADTFKSSAITNCIALNVF